MKKEYDFSKGERGKFYRSDAKINLPIYLDEDVSEFIKKYAEQKNLNMETVVNDWLREDISQLMDNPQLT